MAVSCQGRCQPSSIKALLESRKERQEECLSVADTITFTCSDLSESEPRTISFEGFIHGYGKIGGCSLNQWLPMNHIPELKAIEFEAVYPGHGQLDRRYRKYPTIKKFLDETSLEPCVDGKLLRFDFLGSSAEPERPHLEKSNTWLLRASCCFTGDRNFSHVLADRLDREKNIPPGGVIDRIRVLTGFGSGRLASIWAVRARATGLD